MRIFDELAERFLARRRKRQQATLAKRIDSIKAQAEFHREALEALEDFGVEDGNMWRRPRACGSDVPVRDAYQDQVNACVGAVVAAHRRQLGLPPAKVIDRYGREIDE